VSILGGAATEFDIRATGLERSLLEVGRSRTFWVPNAALEAPAIARRRPRIVATLKNVVLRDQTPDVIARVFANCPYLASDTPSSEPHYAGSFSFFGVAHHGAGQFDVDAMRRSR
jgi:tyrosinase